MNQIRKHWLLGLVGLVCLGFAVSAIIFLVNDCPKSVCVNPILRNQLYANAHITAMNRIYSMLLTDNKALIPSFERGKCFKQEESYVFVCQTLDLESASPTAFNYAFSKQSNLKSYAGGIFVVRRAKQKTIIQSLVCEAQIAGTQVISRPIDAQTCGQGTIRVKEYVIP